MMLTSTEIGVRLLLSALLGSIVGLERERLDWVAGLRTHMLVSVGSTLVMLVSVFGFSDVVGKTGFALDPSRVAAQVVSGIGFLGAGTIMFRKEIIRGLTTAASLWTVGAVGLCVGGGLYLAAVCGTTIVMLILVGMKPIERRLYPERRARQLTLLFERNQNALQNIESAVADSGLKLLHMHFQPSENKTLDQIQITLAGASQDKIASLIDALGRLHGVVKIDYDVHTNG